MAIPDFLGVIPAARRARLIAAIKTCEGDPSTPEARRKKDGNAFTDEEWVNFWFNTWVRGKLMEAEQVKKNQEATEARTQINADFPEE